MFSSYNQIPQRLYLREKEAKNLAEDTSFHQTVTNSTAQKMARRTTVQTTLDDTVEEKIRETSTATWKGLPETQKTMETS